ncbi:hypothetical protein MY11210_009322, partial [Beauveria gryllotalpidicola]
MPLCTILLLAAVAAAAAAASMKRAGCSGFAGTCGRAFARNGTSGRPDADMALYATYCLDTAGERHYNPAVRANDCLGNSFGRLTGGKGFAYSCRDFGIDPIGTPNVFKATCADGQGHDQQTQIDLSKSSFPLLLFLTAVMAAKTLLLE